jgi:deoxyribonuclease V
MTVNPELEIPDIRRYVLELLRQVPPGKVTTYRALALALGDPMAARAVGLILAANERPDVYPCYKVVHSDGRVGEYSAPGGTAEKIEKLQAEGVPVEEGRVANLRAYVFHEFQTEWPLKKLRELQEELAARVRVEPLPEEPVTVGGVDLSYPGPWEGVGAYVMIERATVRVLASRTMRNPVSFPYIPTYLAFRELPVLLPLLGSERDEGKLVDVLMVDGSGILHHRRAGIASHLGVLLDIPTIGVIKKLLYGRVDTRDMSVKETRPVRDPHTGATIGMAIKTAERADPIYISVGHRVDLNTAVRLVLELSRRKLPEPIRLAHQLCTEAARRSPDEEPSTQAQNEQTEQATKQHKQMALDL